MRAAAACSAGGLLFLSSGRTGESAAAAACCAACVHCRVAAAAPAAVTVAAAVPWLPLHCLRGSAFRWHGTGPGLLLLRFSNCSEPPLSERSGEETSDMGTGIWIVESCDSALLNMMLHEDQ